MAEELYDEFGNYIGPDLDDENQEDSAEDDLPQRSEQDLES